MEGVTHIQRRRHRIIERHVRSREVEERKTDLDQIALAGRVAIHKSGMNIRMRKTVARELLIGRQGRVVVEAIVLGIEAEGAVVDGHGGESELKAARKALVPRSAELFRPAPSEAQVEGVQSRVAGAVVVQPGPAPQPTHTAYVRRITTEPECAVWRGDAAPLLTEDTANPVLAVEHADVPRAQRIGSVEELREVDVLGCKRKGDMCAEGHEP